MATPFSRTIRSIQIDTYYLSLAGLLVAIMLAILWGHWFLNAHVTSYEISQNVYVTDKEKIIGKFYQTGDGTMREQFSRQRIIVAGFPKKSFKNIQVGQIAYVMLDGKIGTQISQIPATVVDVIYKDEQKQGTVVLQTDIKATAPNPFEEGGGGEVRIEVDYVTPATLVLRASGLLTETAPLSSSSR